VNASRTARERVRAELTREIAEIARRQLATDGAAGLSLRAVAREMGMVSSAIYRYFSSRDELLTALIIDGYNALGAAVEDAEGACPRDDYAGRWLAACQAVRAWAVANPHEYALVYGSPVPGYQAPERTIEPATRVAAVLGAITSDAYLAGARAGAHSGAGGTDPSAGGRGAGSRAEGGGAGPVSRADGAAAGAGGWPVLPGSFAGDAAGLRDSVLPGVPDDLAARSLATWAGVFGLVSFELFGQFQNVVTDREDYFRYAAACLGRLAGLPT
jgi:AcrR family transcriptional regulator